MRRRHDHLGWALLSVACAGVFADRRLEAAVGALPPPMDATYRWFSVAAEIAGIPPSAEFVPVSFPIDFSALVTKLGVAGVVDDRSLQLFEIAPDGKESEVPLQFTPAVQPRPNERRLLAGTAREVSYLAEYSASETPANAKVAGQLAWVARGNSSGHSRYRLRFGIAKNGRVVQVPYLPQNLRVFDEQDRATPLRWFPQMQIRPQQAMHGMVNILAGQQLFATYHTGPAVNDLKGIPSPRRPYLYPVNGPDGISLTEFGKPHDPSASHAHHYSLWIAHANVNGHDFWSEKGGTIAHEQFEEMENGPVFCRVAQTARWSVGNTNLIHERRQLVFYSTPEDFRLIDFDLEFSARGSEPVTLGKTSFGFLAARVAQSMSPFDGGGEITNASGERNEAAAHLKRAPWIDQSGPIAPTKWGGIAILDHPDNPGHPTGWHCRNDGWAGAAFNMEKPYVLEPGHKLRLRYRVHLHRHDSIRGEVARRFQEFAARPSIQFANPEE